MLKIQTFQNVPLRPRSHNSAAPWGIILSTFHPAVQATGLVLTLAGDTLVMEEVNPQIDRWAAVLGASSISDPDLDPGLVESGSGSGSRVFVNPDRRSKLVTKNLKILLLEKMYVLILMSYFFLQKWNFFTFFFFSWSFLPAWIRIRNRILIQNQLRVGSRTPKKSFRIHNTA